MYWEYYVYIFCSSLASFETEKFQNFVREENLTAAVVLKQKSFKMCMRKISLQLGEFWNRKVSKFCMRRKFRSSWGFETEKFQNGAWENCSGWSSLKSKEFQKLQRELNGRLAEFVWFFWDRNPRINKQITGE